MLKIEYVNEAFSIKKVVARDQSIPFRKRLIKNRNYLFNYLYHNYVPSDNNGSERAIRNVKVKQKVSGQFRSEIGANSFAVIRSVIDTLIKRNKNIFECLAITANLVPE